MGHILRTDEEKIKLIEVIRETVKRKQISIRKARLEADITDRSYYNWLKRLRLKPVQQQHATEKRSDKPTEPLKPSPLCKVFHNGKTRLTCALAHKACLEGYKVRNFRSPRLFRELHTAQGDGTYLKLLTAISKCHVLIIDDWGLETLKDQQRNDLLEVFEDRNGISSTIITSQLPVEYWHEVVGNPTIADAVLDRLVHNAHKIALDGDSISMRITELGAGFLHIEV